MKAARIFQLVMTLLIIQSCGSKKSAQDFNSDFLLYADYISSFTSGVVSSDSDIRVVLNFENKEWKINEELDANLFSISPSVKGKVIALSANTIAFQPEERLKENTEYQVTFDLSKLIKTKKDLEVFKFTIKIIKQDFTVVVRDLQSYSRDWYYLNATIRTSDNIDTEKAKELVVVKQNGKELPLKFGNKLSKATEFDFIIDSIQRTKEDSKIEISWNGKPLGIDRKGTLDYDISGRDNFKIVNVEVINNESQVLVINFSDPVKKGQNLKGLVSVENAKDLKYSTEGNLLKVFFEEALSGELLVEVFQGIESVDGIKLKETYKEKISFDQAKPAIRFLKNGSILPSSNNLKVNFEAVNIKAVDVKIYKIYQNNILQFLQDNTLNGNYNLRKVASPIKKTRLELSQNKLSDYGKWNVYALDLSSIITPEPGAIYRVELSFKKAYSLYKCANSEAVEEQIIEEELEDEIADDEEYYYYYHDDYDWDERDNPCHNTYYYQEEHTKAATNILASDLGIIAKKGRNNSYFFAVSDIVTAKAVQGVNIDLYTYQQQKIDAFTTDQNGTASFTLDKKAYFAIATKGVNSTYIKLDEGLSQSVSNFDVSGNELQKGLKGYLYGERGVWRPGDTLYLSFILNDLGNKLPKTHPIKLRLSDPSGKLVKEMVQNYNEQNHYKFVVTTDENAPTGNWEAVVSVGGARFYKSIKIETIKPNRLKIKNGFKDIILSASKVNKGELAVAWLHGAVARNLKVEMQAKFTQQKTIFKAYDRYVFDDPTKDFRTEEVNVFSGRINDEGKTTVSIAPELERQSPGMLKVAFITKAYENGGDVSTDVISSTYSPYNTYVGVKTPETNKYGMLETDKVNRFDIVTVDENGRPKAVNNLDVKVYKIEWSWWWDASNNNLSNYNSSSNTIAYKTYKLSTDANGKGSVQFKVPESDWGRYLIRVADPNGGHATGETVLIDWPIWSGKTKNTNAEAASMLVFTTDKKKYSVGETAKVSFPSSEGSRALISIENGTEVVQTLWADTKKGETLVDVPITSKMAPNVYFYVTLLQPHASTANDSPIRMYGIVPIEVVDKNTILEPLITMPEVLRPEQMVDIKVKEKMGKPMSYTIAIVDDGLLDLTRFKTPNAWDKFYSREALGVKTWDVYDDVIGAYGGKINQVLSIGGDEDIGGSEAKKANRFKPVVIYLGPFTLGANKTETHKIKMPKYIGSVRTMVVASELNNAAYGSAEKTTPVRNPLMVLASMPRKLSPKEKLSIPITVFAMEKQIKNVSLQIKTTSGVKVLGNNNQQLSFTQPDEKMAYFELEVGDLTGIVKVEVLATSGSEKASYEVEIDVINPNPISYDYKEVVLEANQSQTISWQTFGVMGSNKAGLEVSSFPSINFHKRIDYLIQYPHGCLEQVTSAVFPQLYIGDIIEIDAKRKEDIQRNIAAGIQKLASYQIANGGFAYWPGKATADDWSTSYVGHFYLEAEKKGYVLPVGFKNKWIAFQKQEAKQWRFLPSYGNDLAQAYRLYTLALAGVSDLASMNRLRETVGISNESKLRLAAAYAIAGQKQAGLNLLAKSSIDVENSNYRYYYYGSTERNRAMVLETLLLLDQKEKSFIEANKVAKDLSANNWMSTQTSAYCLYAMSKFAAVNGGKGIDVAYTFNNKTQPIKTNKTFSSTDLNITQGSNSLTIKNNKANTLYVRLGSSGVLPVGQELAVSRNLSSSVVFKDRNGNHLTNKNLVQGTEFVAEVTITNTTAEYVENIALTQIIPSGWEIVNTRFTDYGDFGNNAADYTDIRDDRTYFYFGLKGRQSKTFKILLNASYLGYYYLPGLQAEAMYDNNYLVRTKGEWVSVLKE